MIDSATLFLVTQVVLGYSKRNMFEANMRA